MRALLAFALCACTVGPLDATGKRCSQVCPDSLICLDGTCQRIETEVYVSGFRFDWATPNSIRWAWDIQGNPPALVSYELELRRETGQQSTVVVTSAELTELGGYQIRRSSGFDVLTGVITPDLEPSTVYAATLRVRDVNGRIFSSPTVRGTTDGPRSQRLLVYRNALPSGAYTLPGAPEFSQTNDGLDGGRALTYRASLVASPEYENLRVGGLELVPADLTPKLLETAYLEFWIRGRGTPSSSWCEIWLRVRGDAAGCDDQRCHFRYAAKWVYRPDTAGQTYRRVQLPLSAFDQRDSSGARPTVEVLERGIDEVNVGLPFVSATDQVSLDDIAIWW